MKSTIDYAKIDHAGDSPQHRNSTNQPTPVTVRTSILTPARTALLLGFLTVIGAALRLHSLAVRSLWIDEAASVSFASLDWKPLLKVLWGYQGNMALYYVLLHKWIHLGDSEFAVRNLSVLCGVLTIPAVYLLAARLFDRPTGLISAALLTVHSFHIHWSQETRAYSFLILLLVLTLYAFVTAIESNSKLTYWLAFSVLSALSIYAHIFALLVLTTCAVAIIFPRPFRVELPTVVASAAVFALLCEPMAAFVVLQHSDQLAWMARPSLAEIWEFLKLLTSQGGALLVVVYLGLCGLAFLQPAGAKRTDKESWALRLILLWLISLPLLTLAVSLIKPLFYPRYMVICVPALIILAGRGLVNLYDMPAVRRWAAGAFVLVIALSGWGTWRYFANLPNETSDWRSAVTYILQREHPGDGAVFFLANTYCYQYYVHRAEESQHRAISAPDVLYPPSPWQPVTRAEIQQVTSGHERVWLILHIDSINPQSSSTIQSTLAETYQLVDKHEFPGEDLITIALYDRKPLGH